VWRGRPNPKRDVATFDSSTAMLRALSRYLRGQDVPLLGELPGGWEPVLSAVMGAANRLPRGLAEKAYAVSGWSEAIPAGRTGEISADDLAEWIAGHYPRRRYPVVFVGSSDGALVHLAAALGAPWLPQTVLIPVRRRGGHPDEPREALRAHRAAGEALLAANPGLVLHHMHDANQDRLMVAGMSYFRVKWRVLPPAYRAFLRDCLEPGGTVIVSDCEIRWPTTRVAERYVFQHGALGGATVEEFRHGSPRISDYLARYGSPHRRWDAPEPDGESPEAEWGFEPELLPGLLNAVAELNGDPDGGAGGDAHAGRDARVVRLRFSSPEDLSAPVADLYRQWHRSRGLPGDRLLVECFAVLEPWWTVRTGSVPYWMVFNTQPSQRSALSYLDAMRDAGDPYDEIRLMLFSHGVDSPGLASIEMWREVLARARKIGVFTGVDTRAYPRDFACLARAHRELSRVRGRYPMPPPMRLADARRFLAGREEIDWIPQPFPPPPPRNLSPAGAPDPNAAERDTTDV
jgi:hypothetical protein